MEWLKKLQEKYKAGKLTKEQYDAKVKELLEDGDLDQAEHDEALKYDPKDDGEKLIYSEADMQRMAHNVARRTIKQELKKAGVELDVDNKGLLAEVAKLAKIGKESDGKGATATEAEIAQLRKDAAKVKPLETKANDLALENAVLKSAGKYQPHNAAQVVRALADYRELIDLDDETGLPTPKSVQAVISKLAKVEPNLFKTPDGSGSNEEPDDKGGGSNSFHGKPPGGAAAGGGQGGGKPGEYTVAEALARMDIKTEQQK